jgi:hypothetical protein
MELCKQKKHAARHSSPKIRYVEGTEVYAKVRQKKKRKFLQSCEKIFTQ